MNAMDTYRFEANLVKSDGCWGWRGFSYGGGYSGFNIKIDGKWRVRYAHRIAYTLYERELSDGEVLHHICENKGCCNPSHLRPITQAEHMREHDLWEIRAHVQRTLTHCKRGHKFTEENTGYQGTKRYCRECHRMRVRRTRARALAR